MKTIIALLALIPTLAFGQVAAPIVRNDFTTNASLKTNNVVFTPNGGGTNNAFVAPTISGTAPLTGVISGGTLSNNTLKAATLNGIITLTGSGTTPQLLSPQVLRFVNTTDGEITADAQDLNTAGYPGWGVRNNQGDGIIEHYTSGTQLSIGNFGSSAPYAGRAFISSFHSNGISPGPDFLLSWEGQFGTDGGHRIHVPFMLSPSNTFARFYNNGSDINFGTVALDMDLSQGGIGVVNLNVGTTNGATGPGTVSLAAGAAVTFTSSVLDQSWVGALLNCSGGATLQIINVNSATTATVWDYVNRNIPTATFSGNTYTLLKSSLRGAAADKTQATVVDANASLIIKSSSNAKLVIANGTNIWALEKFGTIFNWHSSLGTDPVTWDDRAPNASFGLGQSGLVTIPNGVTSGSSNISAKGFTTTGTPTPQAITATGFTNTTGTNGTAYVKGTAITFTNFNSAGTAVDTNTTLVNAVTTIIMNAGDSFKAASGLSGSFR